MGTSSVRHNEPRRGRLREFAEAIEGLRASWGMSIRQFSYFCNNCNVFLGSANIESDSHDRVLNEQSMIAMSGKRELPELEWFGRPVPTPSAPYLLYTPEEVRVLEEDQRDAQGVRRSQAYRVFDTEAKFLEYVAKELQRYCRQQSQDAATCHFRDQETGDIFRQNQFRGVVELISDLKVCQYCEVVVQRFQTMFPNVVIHLHHGFNIRNRPKPETGPWHEAVRRH